MSDQFLAQSEHLAGDVLGILRRTKAAKIEVLIEPSNGDSTALYGLVEWPSFGGPYRQLISFLSDINHISAKEIGTLLDNFQVLMKSHNAMTGLIVSREIAPAKLRSALRRFPSIKLITRHELLDSAADFTQYVKEWFPQKRPADLEKYYVERRWKRLHLSSRDQTEIETTSIGDLSDYIDDWLHKPGQVRQLAVLGDAGTGKTWLSWHSCERQMRKFISNPEEERLPIYIRLRDYNRFYDIVAFITDRLEELGLKILGGYEGLRAFSKRFFLVLDGFDEMESRKSQATIFRTFDEINRLITTESRVLLTSRKVMFHGMDRLRHLFTPSDPLPEEILEMMPYDMGRAARNEFQVVELESFNDSEIQEALKRRELGDESGIDNLTTDANLAELATTPILFDRLVDILPRLRPGDLNEGAIYEHLVQDWIERPQQENRAFLRNTTLKEFFCEYFAWHLAVRDTEQLLYVEFPWSLIRLVRDIEENPLEDPVKDDLRTQTFLETDLKGYYKFTHESFRDFFLARKLARELDNRDWSHFGRLPLAGMRGALSFIADLLKNPTILWDVLDESRFVKIADWQPNKRFASSNAATILSHKTFPLAGRNLTYSDFSGAVLANADLRRSDVRGTNFEGADLTNALVDELIFDDDTNFHNIKGLESLRGIGDHLSKKIRDDQERAVVRFPYPPPDLTILPGGAFRMGSDVPRFPDEHDVHTVAVDPFFMDIHEVTNEQFYEFVRERQEWGREECRERLGNEYYLELWNQSSPEEDSLPFSEKKLHHPVVYVSWFSAVAFCNWRSKREGLQPCYPTLDGWYNSLDDKALGRIVEDVRLDLKANGYRLPTEAEWEFAARGGHDQWEYPWGMEFEKDRVVDSKRYTSPVLMSEPDEYGVTGLVGNVREWCNDWYGPTYYKSTI